MQNNEFSEMIWHKAGEHYREMPWRTDTRPYYVLVSELMLQQTQVARVIPKFEDFIVRFPNEQSLAKANLSDVLIMWQGLGYNRRAKYLHDGAKRIVTDFDGIFPVNPADILSLPGVGKNTLGAIQAYAFNRPRIFVETNIRTVYIHHFFNGQLDVDDKLIVEKLELTIDREHPREFYWALMDYGAQLKADGVRNISQSKHYKKQSALQGSVRQVRGQILRVLSQGVVTSERLKHTIEADERYTPAINGLLRDGLIVDSPDGFHLTK